MRTEGCYTKPPNSKRRGKWVKFSGSDEDLAKIALEHANSATGATVFDLHPVAKYQSARLRPLLHLFSFKTPILHEKRCKTNFLFDVPT